MYFITTKRMLEVCFSAHPNIQYRTFLFNRKVFLLNKNRSAEDRTAAVGNYVAEATRRRRIIPRAGFYLIGGKQIEPNI